MPLAARVSYSFASSTRKKGTLYFKAGKVQLNSCRGDEVEAVVNGSYANQYDVTIDWSKPSQGVVADCDCPHYLDGNFCKHLWATLLEIDDQQLTKGLKGSGRLLLEHEYDREDDYDYEYDEADGEEFGIVLPNGEYLQLGTQGAATTKALSPPSSKSSKQSWQQQLRSYGPGNSAQGANDGNAPGHAPQRERQLLYVLNIGASFQAAAPVIQLHMREKKKNGEWGVAREFSFQRSHLQQFDMPDRKILSLALGNPTRSSSYGNYYRFNEYQQCSQMELTPEYHELLLPALCETGRFGWVLGEQQEPAEAEPLAWDDGAAWQLLINIATDKKKKQWTLTGEIIRDVDEQHEEHLPLSQPVLILTSGVVFFSDFVGRFDPQVDGRWLSMLRANDKLVVPFADRALLLQEIWSSPRSVAVNWPEDLQPTLVEITPTGYVKIQAAQQPSSKPQNYKPRYLQGELGFLYGETPLRMDAAQHAVACDENEVVLRDYEAERRLLDEAADLGLEDYQDRYYEHAEENIQLPRTRFTEIVRELTARGWQVEAEGAKVRSAGSFNINVTSGVDWFDLESDIDFGEASASLPDLLAAAKTNNGYVELSDGSRGLLPEEWLEKFAPLAELAEVHEDKLRFRPSQALLLDALLSEREGELQVQLDRQFRNFREKLTSFKGIKPEEAPRGFQGELRHYQRDGLGWMQFLQDFNLGGCLADDMGLGKTVQVLALLQSRRARRLKKGEKRLPSLVVAPKSVAGNWLAEAGRFAPRLVALNYTGNQRKELVDQFDDADLIVTTYGTLRRDIEELSQREFDYVILDESQAIKNDKSQSAKACRLLKASHRLALTGTPIENHLGELWSQFEFLNPGMLGRSSAFRNFTRGSNSNDDEARQAQLAALQRAISPFLLRRTKEEVLKDLPEKQEQSLTCKLNTADRKRYNELRDHYRNALLKRVDSSGMNKSKMHVLEALLRLRQAACHPGLIDKKLAKNKSAKLELLLEQLEDVIAGGHKALIFSQFTSMLSIVKDRLDKQGIVYEYLDGKTRKRQEKVDRFQTDADCPVFLISLKAGGTGLNLTAADYVFVLDPWWNPAVEAQAIDRAHRIGQSRNVFAYRLIAEDTVEEKILELQKQKRELADALIAGNESLLQQMSAEDLQLLLS